MEHYAQFSVGDYEIDNTAEFAKFNPNFYNKGVGSKLKDIGGGAKGFVKKASSGIPGVRKAHIRNVKGKAQMVGQSTIKAGKKTAGALKAGASKGLAVSKKYGAEGLKQGQKYAGRAGQYASKGLSKGADLAAKNPRIAGGLAIAGAGAGVYGATRPKRKRR